MNQQESMIDQVLVHLFNDLLRIEEKTLQKQCGPLSMREIHIIESVCAQQEDDNTMTVLAAMQRVTVGSLTVAVKTLESKGYVQRVRSDTDKRRVHVLPLPPALEVEKHHREYHRRMVQAVTSAISRDKLDVLIQSLHAISDYFYTQEEA
jgi:DNA-binding MarR family transcriptional regulator